MFDSISFSNSLVLLLNYLGRTRRVGHTATVLSARDLKGEPPLIIAVDQAHVANLKQQALEHDQVAPDAITLSNLVDLDQRTKAMLLDNYTVIMLLSDAVQAIRQEHNRAVVAERKLAELKYTLTNIVSRIPTLG